MITNRKEIILAFHFYLKELISRRKITFKVNFDNNDKAKPILR